MTQGQGIFHNNSRKDFAAAKLYQRIADLEKRMVQGGRGSGDGGTINRADKVAYFPLQIQSPANISPAVQGIAYGAGANVLLPFFQRVSASLGVPSGTDPDTLPLIYGISAPTMWGIDYTETGNTLPLTVRLNDPPNNQTVRATVSTLSKVSETGQGAAMYWHGEILIAPQQYFQGGTTSDPITGGDQVAKQFTIARTTEEVWSTGTIFAVTGSTGNDGPYTVASSAWAAGVLTLTVLEAIPDPTLDGTIERTSTLLLDVSTTGGRFSMRSLPSQVRRAGIYYPNTSLVRFEWNAFYAGFPYARSNINSVNGYLLVEDLATALLPPGNLSIQWAPDLGPQVFRLRLRHPTTFELYEGTLSSPTDVGTSPGQASTYDVRVRDSGATIRIHFNNTNQSSAPNSPYWDLSAAPIT